MSTSDALSSAREALTGRGAWIVGGAVRDQLLGRPVTDLDLAVPGDVQEAAHALRQASGGAAFELSGAFGAWRVTSRDGGWHVDLVVLQENDIGADLAQRDFTINAMARPLDGGEVLDPHGGRADLEARRLRMVSEGALADDPLRTLRAVRLATELDLTIEPRTAAAVARHAPGLPGVAAERLFGELKRVVTSPRARSGLELMEHLGVADVILPELPALRGVQQNVFHHADVHDHTLEVLERASELQADPTPLGRHAEAVAALLAEPLADDLSRGDAVRFAALLHDAAKPATRGERPDGRVTFVGHDEAGARLAEDVLRDRWRASARLAGYVAALTRHHLRLGFLVHERPLERRTIWRYLTATSPYAADVTVFTVADRLATRGRNAQRAIAAHLEVACEMLDHALGPKPGPPLIRGDELAAELGRRPGPWLKSVLEQLEEDRFAGDLTTRAEALDRARHLLDRG